MRIHILTGVVVISLVPAQLISQKISVTRLDASSLTADFAVGDFAPSTKRVDGRIYQSFASQISTIVSDPEVPALPYFPQSVLVQNNSECRHKILYDTYVDILDIDIEAPARALQTQNPQGVSHVDAFFPGDLVTFNQDHICQNTNGEIKFALFPYQYNPVQHKLRVYKNLKLIIELVRSPAELVAAHAGL